MLRLSKFALLLALVAASMHATPILQCSFNAGAFVTAGCDQSVAFLASNDFLDWGAPVHGFGAADTSNPNQSMVVSGGTWNTTSNGGLGVGAGEITNVANTLERRDNAQAVPNGSGGWTLPTTQVLYGGRFDSNISATSPGPSDPTNDKQNITGTPPYYGDHLIGFVGNTSQGILLVFNQPVYSIGFRISARSDSQANGSGPLLSLTPAQDLTIKAYNTTTPTISTNPYLSFELQDSTGFGTCNLTPSARPPQVVTPCNDAPYIGIDTRNSLFTSNPLNSVSLPGNPWISSVLITSTDPTGFYIDELFLQTTGSGTDTPEPATPLLIGSGLAAAAILFKKKRRS
jgi:hypothetical protein